MIARFSYWKETRKLKESIWEIPHSLNSAVKMATDLLFESSLLNAHCLMVACHCYSSHHLEQPFFSTCFSKFFKHMVALQPYGESQITYSRRSGFSPSEIILFRIAITGTPCVAGGRII